MTTPFDLVFLDGRFENGAFLLYGSDGDMPKMYSNVTRYCTSSKLWFTHSQCDSPEVSSLTTSG
jgi:hypothetical protein